MRFSLLLWRSLMIPTTLALTVDPTSKSMLSGWLANTQLIEYLDSIKSAASTVAFDLMSYYTGNLTVSLQQSLAML